jgi:hypothetical protein
MVTEQLFACGYTKLLETPNTHKLFRSVDRGQLHLRNLSLDGELVLALHRFNLLIRLIFRQKIVAVFI